MQNILSVLSVLLIINVLLLLFSVNSNAQTLNTSTKTVEDDNALNICSDTINDKKWVSDLRIKAGYIESESMLQATGSTTFTLSNGVKVHYKFADKNKNNVLLNVISYGGVSLVKDTDLPLTPLLGYMVPFSGLGYYSATDLSKTLVGKTASTDIHISSLVEGISGSSTTTGVEALLQIIHLRFVKPRFAADTYQVLIENPDNYIIRRSHAMNEKISDSVTASLCGNNHPKRRLFKVGSFDKLKTVCLERFHNAADFEFFIVGDIEIKTLRLLLETYIASIPTNNKREVCQNNSGSRLKDVTEKDILNMEMPRSFGRIGYKNIMKYSLKTALIAKALGDILRLRFAKTLGLEQGVIYGVSASVKVSKRPIEHASIQVAFDCHPDKVGRLVAMVHQEIENITNEGVSQTHLEKATMNYLKERKGRYNSYDMSLLMNCFREGFNMDDSKNFEDIVNTISIKDVQAFTKALLKDSKSYKVVFNPKG